MSINLIRPITADGVRLFYRSNYDVRSGMVGGHYRGPLFIPPKGNDQKGLFRLLDPDNVLAQIRLYRWFSEEYERDQKRGDGNFSNLILKDDLMGQCFEGVPMSKHRIGRMLRMIVQYETNFQKNRSPKTGNRALMYWRWTHPLDVVYGLEHLMATWLPRVVKADGGKCETTEDLIEEFQVLLDQEQEEDHELVAMILEKKLY